jgi:hypothetical protein
MPLDGDTENDGVFSVWKGQSPLSESWPVFRSER